MFEQLFGSKTRVKLMRIFLDNPTEKFYVRELTRLTDSLINSVRRELDNLVKLDFVLIEDEKFDPADTETSKLNPRKYYYLNSENVFHRDLTNLFSKGKLLIEKNFVEQLKLLGDIKYMAICGSFVDDDKAETDLLIIGRVERAQVVDYLDRFEKETGRAVRYTIMDEVEFHLRLEIEDRFVKSILANPKNIIVIDKIFDKKNVEQHVSQGDQPISGVFPFIKTKT